MKTSQYANFPVRLVCEFCGSSNVRIISHDPVFECDFGHRWLIRFEQAGENVHVITEGKRMRNSKRTNLIWD